MSDLNEKIERQIAFIVAQQAQTEVRWAENQKQWAEANKRWEETETSVRGLLAIAEMHENQLTALEQGQRQFQQQHEALNGQLAELVTAGQRTDERLNILIGIIERHVNGRGE